MGDRFKPSNHIDKSCFQAALYGRLSDEDKGKIDEYMESNSIKNQRDYLYYAIDCLNQTDEGENNIPVKVYGEYFDDDYTGITFDRPQFQAMMNEVEKGNVDCIIVKDFSRFGRDYSRIIKYLENDFEMKKRKIRFVAFSDHFDSLRDRPDIGVRIMLFLNEEYSHSQSHKVTTAMMSKMRVGLFIGAFAPYGYKKDPEDKNHLIIDEEASRVVREIFRMNLKEGLGVTEIAKRLNAQRIDPPSIYKKKNGSKYKCGKQISSTNYWSPDTVNNILFDEKYTGTMVQHKVMTKDFKAKEMEVVDKEKWIVVPDMHEAIISKEDFEAVQALHKNVPKNKNKCRDTSIYAGILKCGDCGHALIKNSEKYKDSVYRSHLCRTHKRDVSKCYTNRIYDNSLDKIILSDFNRIIRTVQNLEKVVRNCKSESEEIQRKRLIYANIQDKEEEMSRLKDLLDGAEEKWLLGRIDDEKYETFQTKYQSEIQVIQKEIGVLNESLASADDILSNPWISSLLKKGCLECIDRETVIEMIESIRIYHDNRLEINYKFSKDLAVLFATDSDENII